MSSSRSTPSAFAILRSLPNTFIASGMEPRAVVENQSRTAVAHDPVHDLGGFQSRIDRYPDVPEIPFALQAVRKSRMSEYG